MRTKSAAVLAPTEPANLQVRLALCTPSCTGSWVLGLCSARARLLVCSQEWEERMAI